MSDNSTSFILKKSRGLSYALLRVAVYIRRQDLRERIEKWSFELLENTSLNDFEKSLKTIEVLETLVNFGKLIYEIEPINTTILVKELQSLSSAIRQFAGLEKLPNLESLFSKSPTNTSFAIEYNNEEGAYDDETNGNGVRAVIRQSAILEKIRQKSDSGCQLKDLAAIFPDVSERTLRYDLQKLVGQGLVNKIGNSGPGTSYYTK